MARPAETFEKLSHATGALVAPGELRARLESAGGPLQSLHALGPAFESATLQQRFAALVATFEARAAAGPAPGEADIAKEILALFSEACFAYTEWLSRAGRSC